MASGGEQTCHTDILVDIDTETYEILVPLSSQSDEPNSANPAVIETEKIHSKSQDTCLCGYLAKVNHGGLMKASKTRWFIFDKDECVLNYYRSPKDTTTPLGSISISNAAFTCTAEGLLMNSFQIMSASRAHIVQACDQKTMLWWLQELQAERRLYNVNHKRTNVQKNSPVNAPLLDLDDTTDSGLLKTIPPGTVCQEKDVNESRDSLSVIPVLPRIVNPPDTVGIKSANLNLLKPVSSSTLSEIGSKVTQFGAIAGGITKLRTKPARPAPPSPASVFYAKRKDTPTDEHLTLGPALKAKNKSAMSRSSSGFAHLLDKILNDVKRGNDDKSPQNDSKHADEIAQTLALVREEMELTKTSLESKEETIQLLKKELDIYSTRNTSSSASGAAINDEAPPASDRPSSPTSSHQMRSEITTLKLTIEHLREEIDETKLLLKQQVEKKTLFQEMLQVKDGIVMQLTNELYEMEKSYKLLQNKQGKDEEAQDNISANESTTSCSMNDKTCIQVPSSEEKKLQDEIEGYRLQNKFLNNEILELTQLRKVDLEHMDKFHDKILHQDALRCQLQSKYFILLSEMDRARSETIVYGDTENPLLHQDEERSKRSVVKQLIQEAIQEGERSTVEISVSLNKYDKYGFTQIVDDADESTLLAAASRLEQNASNIVNSLEQLDATVEKKWQNYLRENKECVRNAEFKSLVRMGIPHDLRHRVWRFLVGVRTQEIRLLLNADGLYYEKLTGATVAPLHAKQIDLDLLRTLPNNRFFAKIDCMGIQRLKRVLGAYSLHNPGIGYCQGLNRIAAVSLLYLGEEDAFWCLVAIVECIMPGEYYTCTLTASQADQRVFRDLLAEKLPRIHKHLENMEIDLSLITFNWFLCVFCDSVPPETMFRIWDVFLNESSKVLFRYGMAFFKHVEEDILEVSDYMTLVNLLRRIVHRMYDVRALTQIAFQGMNPLSMRKIDRFRAMHTERVRAELRQLDILRSEFASRRNKTTSANSDMYSDDEGDDDGKLM